MVPSATRLGWLGRADVEAPAVIRDRGRDAPARHAHRLSRVPALSRALAAPLVVSSWHIEERVEPPRHQETKKFGMGARRIPGILGGFVSLW